MLLPKVMIKVFVLTAWIFLLTGIAAGQETAGCVTDIALLLDTCPSSDPALSMILDDFEIRRNGVIIGNTPCSEPLSAMPLEQYSDELILIQGLRVIHYMDSGRSDHLPWTPGTMYEWMRSKIGGINISDTASTSFCCEMYDGEFFIVVKAQDDFNRDFDRTWQGLSGNIGLYAHEVRHRDGFGHVSCCPTGGSGCDQTYDEGNLSPYAIQWWLNASWLTGYLPVGFSCGDPFDVQQIASWHLSATNGFRNRFCDDQPPLLDIPESPGGECDTSRPDVNVNGIADECEPAVHVEVPLDINPSDCPNEFTVNLKSRGRLPMAIPGTEDFDVAQIDVSTITIAGLIFPVQEPSIDDVSVYAEGDECICQVGVDGYDDLVLHFSRQDVIQALGLTEPEPGTTETIEVTVEGALIDGTPFQATDCLVLMARD